jgi:tetratricopeptide (TPR) repeat protein
MNTPESPDGTDLLDELLYLGSPHEIRSRIARLDRSQVEVLAHKLETRAAALRTGGRRAAAELHERISGVLRGHLDETTTSFIVRPADRLATGLDRRTVPPRRLDDPARRTLGPPGVFISYSRRDQTYVDELVTHLRRAGVPVWVDRQRLPAGGRITKEIRDAIAGCPAFVLVLSAASIESDWVDNEDAWAREHGRARIALRLDTGARWFSVAGLNIVDVTDRSMPPDDVIETLRAAVRDQGGAEAVRWERLDEADRSMDVGIAAQEAHDPDRAEREYRRALQQYEAYGITAGIVSAYHQLGNVAALRDDLDGALELYHRSLDLIQILRDDGEEHALDAGHAQIGQVLARKGDHEGAVGSFTTALNLRRQAGDALGEAHSLHELSSAYAAMASRYFDHTTGGLLDSPEARELHQKATDSEKEALRLFTAHRDRQGIAMATDGLGRLAWAAENLDDAETYLAQSLNIKEVLGWREGIGNSLAMLAQVKLERGRFDLALPMLLRSLAIRNELGSPALAATVDTLAVLQAKIGRPRLVRLAQRDGLSDALATFDDLLGRARR